MKAETKSFAVFRRLTKSSLQFMMVISLGIVLLLMFLGGSSWLTETLYDRSNHMNSTLILSDVIILTFLVVVTLFAWRLNLPKIIKASLYSLPIATIFFVGSGILSALTAHLSITQITNFFSLFLLPLIAIFILYFKKASYLYYAAVLAPTLIFLALVLNN